MKIDMTKASSWCAERPASWQNLPVSQNTAGFSVGIICIPGVKALIPGNIQNASTFDFPVVYKVLRDVTFEQIARGASEVTATIIAAAQELVADGVRAVVGACGSLGHFQSVVANSVPVPVFMSIMTQAPFILQSLGCRQKLGVVFASESAFTPLLRKECGILDTSRIVTIDLLGSCPTFDAFIVSDHICDGEKLLAEVLARIEGSLDDSVGALLLQCSDLPPYSAELQKHFQLPVFDMAGLIKWLHASVAQRQYSGFL